MKKVISLLMLLTVVLSACSINGGKKVVCQFEAFGANNSISLIEKDGQLERIETVQVYNYEQFGITKEEAQKQFASLTNETQKIEFKEKEFKMITTINVKDDDNQTLEAMGLMKNEQGIIEFEQAVKVLTDSGATCK